MEISQILLNLSSLLCAYTIAFVELGIIILLFGLWIILAFPWVADMQQSWVEWHIYKPYQWHVSPLKYIHLWSYLCPFPHQWIENSVIDEADLWDCNHLTTLEKKIDANEGMHLSSMLFSVFQFEPHPSLLASVIKDSGWNLCRYVSYAFTIIVGARLFLFLLQPKAWGCFTTGLISDNFPPASDGQNKLAYNVWYVSALPSWCWCHRRNSTAMSCL